MFNTTYSIVQETLLLLLFSSIPHTLRHLKIYVEENLRVNFDFHLEFNGFFYIRIK